MGIDKVLEKAVLLIPGAWHLPLHYEKVTSQLEGHGVRVITGRLPTNNGASPPNATIYDDINYIKGIVAKEVEAKTHLVVVCHSYGGMVASAALGEFAIAPNATDKGGVTSIIYMAAFVPSENKCLADMYGGSLPKALKTLPDESIAPPPDPARYFYNDLTQEDLKWATDHLVPRQAPTALLGPIPNSPVAWRTIPSNYIICENDTIMLPEMQRAMINNARTEGASFQEFSLQASHSPFLSKPSNVTEIIMKVLNSH